MCSGGYLLVRSGKITAFVAILDTRCLHYFPAAIRIVKIWCPHTEPYSLLLDIVANNSSAGNRTYLRLGQVVYLSVFYNIANSWLQAFIQLVFDGVTVKLKPAIVREC